jgi:hypothetical protein
MRVRCTPLVGALFTIGLMACGESFVSGNDPADAAGGGSATATSSNGNGGGPGSGGGSSSSGTAGGGGGTGGTGAGLCGGPSAQGDDFTGPTLAVHWDPYTEAGATVDVDGDALRLTMQAGAPQGYVDVISDYAVRFQDDAMRAEVPTVVSDDGGTSAMALWWSNNRLLEMRKDGAELQFVLEDGGGEDITSVTYDATAHRFWQLREESGTTHWETSPDATVWQTHRSEPTPAFAAVVYQNFWSYVYDPPASDEVTVFDNLNPIATPWCAADSLSDDFEDGAVDSAWRLYDNNNGCSRAEQNGTIEFALVGQGSCTLESRTLFDLRDSAVTLHFRDVGPMHSSMYLRMQLFDAQDNRLEMGLTDAGDLWAEAVVGGNGQDGETLTGYDISASPWWRLRESGGQVHWEVSGDGTSWDTLKSWTANTPLDALYAHIRVSATGGIPSASTIRIEAYNP